MSCYLKALQRFLKKEKQLNKKIKAAFWFKVRQRWICELDSAFEKEGMSEILEYQAIIYYMFRMHAFVAIGEDLEQRKKRIIDHFLFLHNHFTFPQIKSLYEDKLIFWSKCLDEKLVEVTLQYDERMRFEGQLTLKLLVDQVEVYYIHLLFSEDTIWVGGLQGMKGALDLNKWLTKASNGLRPQNFLFYCLTVLAQRFNISHIKGVTNAYHVYQNEKKSQQKIAFSYDSFWQELGGQPDTAVWFDLPLIYQRKSLDEIGSKKRGQYRKRYELMDEIARDMKGLE